MARRTLLLAAVVALAGCQGANSGMNSAFKLPTPSFNLLAPYGPPRIPPPGTHSYGQPGLLPPTAASAAQPYYPGGATNARGISLPQSPESGAGQSAPSAARGKVAAAAWKSSRVASDKEKAADELAASPASQESSGEAPIRIPDVAVQPSEPVELVLGGMPAHDLTGAVANDPQPGVVVGPTYALASAALPAPLTSRTRIIAPAAAAAPSTGQKTLMEISDLPPADSAAAPGNRSLQRVRGFEQPPVATATEQAAPATFIAPQMTISASAARETRDAVAAAAVTREEPLVKPAPAPAPAEAGWKSRYPSDES